MTLLFAQYGHVWYQNDDNEKFYQMVSLFSKIFVFEFLTNFFFMIFRYIFCHSDLDLQPKVTNFNRVRASAISNYLAKTASKSAHSFGWNFVN